MIKVKDLSTNKTLEWTLEQVLFEINRDHSDRWISYTADDWQEGWSEWVEGEGYYSLVGEY